MLNKRDIKIVKNNTDREININFNEHYNQVDEYSVVSENFIKNTVSDIIGFPDDNEKGKFVPIHDQDNDIIYDVISSVRYEIYSLDSNGNYSNTYDTLGFELDDIKFNLNSFKNSFLRIEFYDSSDPYESNLLQVAFIGTQVLPDDNTFEISGRLKYYDIDQSIVAIETDENVLIKNSISRDINRPSEGYSLYWYNNDKEFINTENSPFLRRNMYIRYSFLNAKNGKVLNLIPYNITDTYNLVNSNKNNINRVSNLDIELINDNSINMNEYKDYLNGRYYTYKQLDNPTSSFDYREIEIDPNNKNKLIIKLFER